MIDNIELRIKSAGELMHEALDGALQNFIDSAEDHLELLLDMSREDQLDDDEDELEGAIDDARELVDDAKKQAEYYVHELDMHGLLNNSYRDLYDEKDVQDAIHELKEKVGDYVDTIGGGMSDDELESSLNDDIDSIMYYSAYYKDLARSMQKQK